MVFSTTISANVIVLFIFNDSVLEIEFDLCDVVDGLLHPHEGPSGRELSKNGYTLFVHKGNRLSGTEIWIKSQGGKITDIRAVDYWAGGFLSVTSYANKFGTFDEARAFFSQYGTTNKQFEDLKPGIQLWKRQTIYGERKVTEWDPCFHELRTDIVREPLCDVYY